MLSECVSHVLLVFHKYPQEVQEHRPFLVLLEIVIIGLS